MALQVASSDAAINRLQAPACVKSVSSPHPELVQAASRPRGIRSRVEGDRAVPAVETKSRLKGLEFYICRPAFRCFVSHVWRTGHRGVRRELRSLVTVSGFPHLLDVLHLGGGHGVHPILIICCQKTLPPSLGAKGFDNGALHPEPSFAGHDSAAD